jgi:OmcA/MtrC family decaheme c-type cytochrome
MMRFHTLWRVAAIAALAVVTLISAPRKPYSIHEKAYYASPDLVEFVLPGLTITINSAAIAANGIITVTYTLTDPNGLPLDSGGVTTPGLVALSYVAAVLPSGQEDYKTYTTTSATGTVLGTIQQPGADSGGVATPVGPGQYQYTFHTTAPAGFDATATHTIGIYGSRNLTPYGLTTNYASATYNFVPNGSAVVNTHNIISTTNCNACHDQLSAHGGSRRGFPMCALCHTPQNSDPNTGDTLDAKVFFHKLHMGASLPSVVAGTPYIPAVNSHGTFNYSTVVFPADPGDPRRCETCHTAPTPGPLSGGPLSNVTAAERHGRNLALALAATATLTGANSSAFLTNPSRAACGACHDNVNFATGANHPGGIETNDSQCSTCHVPQGSTDFDASILGAHVAPTASSLLSGLAVTIVKVTNSTAGNAPVVSFTVKNNAGAGIPLSALGSISFTMAGPTTDYGYTSFGSNVTTPGYVTESASGATCDGNGNCTYTFTHGVPAKATGTYAIGVEARRTETVLAGTPSQQSIEYGTPNKVTYFSVDGSPVVDRRSVVALANCNQCHVSLQLHGTLRNNTEYCVMCHNPSNTDASTRATAVVASDKAAPPQGINFNLLVHRIHYGINMQAFNRTYIVVGFGGSHNDFSGTLFPALSPTGAATDTENCSLCHINSSEQTDVALTGLNLVVDPQGPVNPNTPIASACSGCHVDLPAASHMLSNTTSLGEACAVCHSSGAAYAVDQVHAQY